MRRRTTSDEIPDDSAARQDEDRSKGARKRAATAAQKLGERLIGLAETELAKLPLPEPLLDAVRTARRIRSRGGLARQRQYIGKLMRDVDPEPLLELLAAGTRTQALEVERFHRIEAWRDRLIAEGDTALAALGARRALLPEEHAKLAEVLRRARQRGGSKTQRAAAARELFRTLQALFAAPGCDA